MPIAVKPAKFGFIRLEGKSVAKIACKPLIQRVCEQTCKSSVITGTIYTKSFLNKIITLFTGICEGIEKREQLRILEHGYPIKVIVSPYDSPEFYLPEDIKRVDERLS